MRPSIIFLTIGIILGGFIIWYFSSIFIYIVIAAMLTLIAQPINQFYRRKIYFRNVKLSPTVSALLALLTLFLGFLLLIKVFVPLIVEEVRIFSSIDRNTILMSLQKPVDALEQMLRSFNIDIEHTNVQVYLYEKLISLFTITNLSLLLNRFFSMLGDFLVAVFSIGFLTFFFLRDEELIIRSILSLVPLDYYEKAKKVWLDSERMLKRYFIGLLTETLLVTIFIAVGLWIVGIKYALLIGLFSGLMNVIPYVGPIIGITFALFVGLTTNSDMSMLSVITKILIVFPLINIADNFLLQPFIYSNSVKAHPLEIFLVSLAGSAIGGIGGMILAVPTYTVLRVFIKEFIFGLILRKNKAK